MTLVLALTLAAAAAAAQPADPPAAPATEAATPPAKGDPVVCETVHELGSRIRGRRVCMRRSAWDTQRQSDKMLIQRTQVQRTLEAEH